VTCVRRAWLTLGSLSVELHQPDAGYYVTELDLGTPDVREVVSNRPDADGIDDRTVFMGGRVVSVDVAAVAGAGAQIDAVAGMFAPFMVPSARPTFHYILDRPGLPERTLVVRAQVYAFKVDNDYQRDIHLQWIASDPAAINPVAKVITVYPGASVELGRTYNEVPPRTYPPGDPRAAQGANAYNAGDVPVHPVLRFNGPVTAPMFNCSNTTQGGVQSGRVTFAQSMVIDAGAYVLVDTAQRTAYRNGDPTKDVTALLNWTNMANNGGWPLFQPRSNHWCGESGQSTTDVTNTTATWNERYLT
jgi:hypothetical protein